MCNVHEWCLLIPAEVIQCGVNMRNKADAQVIVGSTKWFVRWSAWGGLGKDIPRPVLWKLGMHCSFTSCFPLRDHTQKYASSNPNVCQSRLQNLVRRKKYLYFAKTIVVDIPFAVIPHCFKQDTVPGCEDNKDSTAAGIQHCDKHR